MVQSPAGAEGPGGMGRGRAEVIFSFLLVTQRHQALGGWENRAHANKKQFYEVLTRGPQRVRGPSNQP